MPQQRQKIEARSIYDDPNKEHRYTGDAPKGCVFAYRYHDGGWQYKIGQAFLGLLASILGLALGMALSLLLIYVVNKQSFGWTGNFSH
jgi:hypothetical protein